MKSISRYIMGAECRGILGKSALFSGWIKNAHIRLGENKEGDRTEWGRKLDEIKREYKEIRLHLIRSERIGECLSIYLRAERDVRYNKRRGILDLFIPSDSYGERNKSMHKIMGRHIALVDDDNAGFWSYVIKNHNKVDYRKHFRDYKERDNLGIMGYLDSEYTKRTLELNEYEESIAKRKCKEMGLNGSFVCISSRDSVYLEKSEPGLDSSYHDYRNSNINNCKSACAYLESNHIQTVRIGRYVAPGMNIDNCIDFADKYYDELVDIALSKYCKFILCDDSGIYLPAFIYGTPVAIKNMTVLDTQSFGCVPVTKIGYHIFKKHYSIKEKRYLNVRECLEVDVDWNGNGEYFKKIGIELHENTEEEIEAFTREMNKRIDGTWVDDDTDIARREKYDFLIKENLLKNGWIDNLTPHTKIATSFLRLNPWLVDEA